MTDLNDYRKEFLNRIRAAAESQGTLHEEEFFRLTISMLSEAGYLEDVEYKDYRNTRLGLRIDGYNYNPLEKQVSAIIIHFDGEDDPKSKNITKSELEKIGKRASRFLEKLDDKNFIEDLDATDPAFEILSSLEMYSGNIVKFRVVLLTDLESTASKISIDNIQNLKTSIEVWDIKKFKDIEESDSEGVPFTVDFNEMCNGLSALPANFKGADLDSYLCIVPGEVLSKLYEDHGQRLLESNVRTFLGTRGKVNRGMRNTLLTNPESFFAYNNGLTLTATSIKKKKTSGGLIITELENLQIVNGGQTTSSIYFSPQEKGQLASGQKFSDIDLSKVFVQAKLTIIGDKNSQEAEDLKSKISQFANTQNAVNSADLVSNHPLHLRIENLSRSMLMPAGESGISTKWFYERARGAYQTTMRAFTASAVRTWQAEYPKNQVFVKTDMAKYENTWRMNPNQVKGGAQANLKILGIILVGEFEKDDNKFREPFYKDLIAKAILFRTTEKEISISEWYKAEKGLRAETVTYTIALLRHLLLKQNEDLNLNRIFQNQKLSDSLIAQILYLAQVVREKINDSSFRDGWINTSEFCRSERAWQKFKELDIEISFLEDIDKLNEDQQREVFDIDSQTGVASEAVDVFDLVMNKTSSEEWTMIAKFYLLEGFNSEHKNVSIPNKCAGIDVKNIRTIPSEKQMIAALEIKEDALAQGFAYIPTET
tara:strand:+ start:1448 stop:3580 length:2133 start_codon:yes stop_codon:yes gene_type:complete